MGYYKDERHQSVVAPAKRRRGSTNAAFDSQTKNSLLSDSAPSASTGRNSTVVAVGNKKRTNKATVK